MAFDNEAHEVFVSQRFIEEALRKNKLAAFDKFIDLALDGVITMDEAILGFREEYVDVPPAA